MVSFGDAAIPGMDLARSFSGPLEGSSSRQAASKLWMQLVKIHLSQTSSFLCGAVTTKRLTFYSILNLLFWAIVFFLVNDASQSCYSRFLLDGWKKTSNRRIYTPKKHSTSLTSKLSFLGMDYVMHATSYLVICEFYSNPIFPILVRLVIENLFF